MKLFKITGTMGLVFGSLSMQSCNKADDKNDPVGTNGKQAQDQMYMQNVTADKPLLVVYGDSISTGVLGNTQLGQNIDNSLLLQIGKLVQSGDYNAEGFQDNLARQDLAASTTDQTYGIRSEIASQKKITAAEVGVVSFAKFGAKSADIPEMIARWQAEEANTIKRKPDYILVALGGNDFCSDTSVEIISETFKTQIDAIQKTAPDAQIVIAPSPPVTQLAAIDFTYGPTISQITGEELSCRKFREQFCKNVYAPDAATRLEGINKGIQDAYQSLKDKGAKVTFARGILSWKILPEELAFDCFHPSQQGQTTLGGYLKTAFQATP